MMPARGVSALIMTNIDKRINVKLCCYNGDQLKTITREKQLLSATLDKSNNSTFIILFKIIHIVMPRSILTLLG